MRFSNESKFSMDVEALYKFVHAIEYNLYSIEESSSWEDHIPSVRVSFNLSMFNHLSAFIALSGDIMVPSWNKKAFTYWDHGSPFGSSGSSFAVYPAISAGVF